MGEYMSRRLRNNDHEVWGYRRNVEAAKKLFEDDALDGYANDIETLVSSVHDTTDSKSVFLMVIPANSNGPGAGSDYLNAGIITAYITNLNFYAVLQTYSRYSARLLL